MVFCSFFAFFALWSYTCLDGFRKHLQRYFFHSDAARLRMLRKNNTFRRGDVAKKQHGCCQNATWMLPKSIILSAAGVGICVVQSAECRVQSEKRSHGDAGDLTQRRQAKNLCLSLRLVVQPERLARNSPGQRQGQRTRIHSCMLFSSEALKGRHGGSPRPSRPPGFPFAAFSAPGVARASRPSPSGWTNQEGRAVAAL